MASQQLLRGRIYGSDGRPLTYSLGLNWQGLGAAEPKDRLLAVSSQGIVTLRDPQTVGNTDPDALHRNVQNELYTNDEVTPAAADWFILEDASDAFKKKRTTYSLFEAALTVANMIGYSDLVRKSADNTYSSGTNDFQAATAVKFKDSITTFYDDADPTKAFKFQASGISAGQTRTYTMPNGNMELAGETNVLTLSSKTLDTSCVINIVDQYLKIYDNIGDFYAVFEGASLSDNRTFNFPDLSGVLIVDAGAQTLSDKTLASPIVTGTLVVNSANADADFQFGSTSTDYLLYGDAGNNRIGINTNAPNYTLDVRGSFGGSMANITLTGTNADYTPASDAFCYRVTVTTSAVLQGWATAGGTPAQGQTLRLWNVSDAPLFFEVAASGNSYRFRFPALFSTGADGPRLGRYGYAEFVYDSSNGYWQCTAFTNGLGGLRGIALTSTTAYTLLTSDADVFQNNTGADGTIALPDAARENQYYLRIGRRAIQNYKTTAVAAGSDSWQGGTQTEDPWVIPAFTPMYVQATGQAYWYTWSPAWSRKNIRTITSSDNASPWDHTILVDASGGPVTVTLPAKANLIGHVLNIKKIDSSANAVTIDGNSSETIDGATTVVFSTQYQCYTIHCGASEWSII